VTYTCDNVGKLASLAWTSGITSGVSGGMRMVHCEGPVEGGPPELGGGDGRRR
jgi:hypothetical protein